MNRINRLAGLVAALAMTMVSVPAGAANIDNVVFFGDSLSDTGNVWFATNGFPPPPYFQGSSGMAPEFTGGQWSSPEGPSWPTLFAGRFGLMATPSVTQVPYANNFAWGGARTGVNTGFGQDPTAVPWLDQQVAFYEASLAGSPTGAGTLVSIMIGGNDVANNLFDPTAIEAGMTSIINQMTKLYGLGVRQFLISNVPDVGVTPRFQQLDALQPGTAALATAVTLQWNAALEAALEELELPGAVITFFDFYSFGQDPELLEVFANTTDACLTETSLCDDPASYFYWDSFHPSSTSHALLAEGLFETLVPTRLQQLLADVRGVGPGKSLARKIAVAQARYESGKYGAACGVLRGFVNQVRAQAGKKLTDAQATAFQSDADTIREAIGCN